MLHLMPKINIFAFSFFMVYNNLRPIRFIVNSDNSFGSRVFSNFTIVGNGNRPVQALQNSVLGCLNEIICSLDKPVFHAAVNLIQCNMCDCI